MYDRAIESSPDNPEEEEESEEEKDKDETVPSDSENK